MKLTPTVLPVIITILAIHRWIGIRLVRHRKFKVIRRIRTLSISTIRIMQCIIILLMIKMFIEIEMCNKLCFSTKAVKCRLDMCFHRTVRHLVCAILIWCDPSSSWRGNIHLGEKGVCEQSNLESLATQGHFDQKFESHQKKKVRPVW